MNELIQKASQVREASQQLNEASTVQKNEALSFIASQIRQEVAYILEENQKDIENARKEGIHESIIDRIALSDQRLEDIAKAVEQLVELDDPIGTIIESWERPNGLRIEKRSVPIGVIGMIYEARPNVTVDAASLCLKTGNAVLLRGSRSAIHSNTALVHVMKKALEKSSLPVASIELLEDTSRELASQMFRLTDYIDVLIPRGGKQLIKTVVEQSSVPVLETGAGNCHIFVDESADVKMAIDIIINAKTQRPSVCNALETVLIHENWAKEHLIELVQQLQSREVEVRADEKVRRITPQVVAATEEDWETEFLDLILAVKVVTDIEEAITHINTYSTKHSEAIITNDHHNVSRFFAAVDAAALYHNASTRFTDGFEFGFGAEIGISTQKLHARGPMGLAALTSSKYTIHGTGQIKQ
ncbi:glutamate-5-semialdehyde dehydrogenase [Radiobacillus kanasensis]|uniref:glutamate-5-semialdehyde dehydrogenase n=1 Tax=Radiobacillus kanasensis TaxID=2844358 RepID=UPI001E4D88BF|nr:glutamate-5-semialdehyde dehydrogenase [Radiobacillus kanasensis]UFU01183.1 glutamate-5-semialdehyde dehydrogenase [Radiobacillus kanasensis]